MKNLRLLTTIWSITTGSNVPSTLLHPMHPIAFIIDRLHTMPLGLESRGLGLDSCIDNF